MIESIKRTSVYKSLNLNKNKSHAYLFYSSDKALNDEIAFLLAKTYVCRSSDACGECDTCKQFSVGSHPDVVTIKQDSIKVDDVNKLMDKLSTKPIVGNKKLFIIYNADNMNEIAQNKLLKSLEEPNDANIFIMTTTKTDKILPTILSRLTKVFVPKLSLEDKKLIASELRFQRVNIAPFINLDTLTEMLNFATNSEYQTTLKAISNLFANLANTADIPAVVSGLPEINKQIFFTTMQDLFIAALNNNKEGKFAEEII
ncbi:MAG: hypothetical protein MJ149_02230, partial [Clostridia bacterium]|nr:hypothetical protein [Clostridia bacterium]